MSYYVRLMCHEDVVQVTEIDREAFPTQWPPANYQHDLRNRLAHYIVVCDESKIVDTPGTENTSGKSWRKPFFFLGYLFRRNHDTVNNNPSSLNRHHILGFAGFWIMADEAHITSIAVRESHRQQGLGELLLLSVMDMAREQQARMVTLEVRVSNIVAQNLYVKYGFNQVGMRRGYYIDRDKNNVETKEDGLIMSTRNINSTAFQAQLRQLKKTYSRKWGKAFPQACR